MIIFADKMQASKRFPVFLTVVNEGTDLSSPNLRNVERIHHSILPKASPFVSILGSSKRVIVGQSVLTKSPSAI